MHRLITLKTRRVPKVYRRYTFYKNTKYKYLKKLEFHFELDNSLIKRHLQLRDTGVNLDQNMKNQWENHIEDTPCIKSDS